jgi:hypothetical protein
MAEQFLNIYPGCFFNLTDSKSTTTSTGRTKSTGHPLNKKCIAVIELRPFVRTHAAGRREL